MHRLRQLGLPVATILAAALSAGCASTPPPPPDTVSVDLHGADGDGLSFRVSSAFVRDAVESALGSSLTCHGDVDPSLATLLRDLDRKGAHAAASVHQDGDELRGYRHGNRLTLRLAGHDGGDIEIRMPWAVAECLLGHAATLRQALSRAGGRPELEIRFSGREGGTFRASLE